MENTNKTNKRDTVILDYGDVKITAKTNLTVKEQLEFVEYVVQGAYINHITPSLLYRKIAFATAFMTVICVDYDVPAKEEDGETKADSQAIYELWDTYNIYHDYETKTNSSLLAELSDEIDYRIENRNKLLIAHAGSSPASDEIAATFLSVMYNVNKLLGVVTDQAEKNGNKLFANLTSKNINKWVNNLQQKFLESVKGGADDQDGFNELTSSIHELA